MREGFVRMTADAARRSGLRMAALRATVPSYSGRTFPPSADRTRRRDTRPFPTRRHRKGSRGAQSHRSSAWDGCFRLPPNAPGVSARNISHLPLPPCAGTASCRHDTRPLRSAPKPSEAGSHPPTEARRNCPPRRKGTSGETLRAHNGRPDRRRHVPHIPLSPNAA